MSFTLFITLFTTFFCFIGLCAFMFVVLNILRILSVLHRYFIKLIKTEAMDNINNLTTDELKKMIVDLKESLEECKKITTKGTGGRVTGRVIGSLMVLDNNKLTFNILDRKDQGIDDKDLKLLSEVFIDGTKNKLLIDFKNKK